MKLLEFEGKKLFSKHGIPIPAGRLLKKGEKLSKPLVLKAQVHSGKRGKAGAIIISRDPSKLFSMTVNGEKVKKVLAEEKLEIISEHYLAIMVDRPSKSLRLIYSTSGGMDIESVPKKKIVTFLIDKKVPKRLPSGIQNIAENLLEVVIEENALLAEINPLVKTKQGYVAADSKIVLDDNINAKIGIHALKLAGDVGVIGNGAGLVMSTIDCLALHGLKASCFIDVGGAGGTSAMKDAIEFALKTKPRIIFVNMFCGITRADELALGIKKMKIPFVVRMLGTAERKGKEILEKKGIHAFTRMDKAIEKLVELYDKRK